MKMFLACPTFSVEYNPTPPLDNTSKTTYGTSCSFAAFKPRCRRIHRGPASGNHRLEIRRCGAQQLAVARDLHDLDRCELAQPDQPPAFPTSLNRTETKTSPAVGNATSPNRCPQVSSSTRYGGSHGRIPMNLPHALQRGGSPNLVPSAATASVRAVSSRPVGDWFNTKNSMYRFLASRSKTIGKTRRRSGRAGCSATEPSLELFLVAPGFARNHCRTSASRRGPSLVSSVSRFIDRLGN